MRYWMTVLLLLLTLPTQASDTLRVGSRVLVTGDSAARVTELLGKPSHKASKGAKGRARSANASGERWQYRRGKRLTTITLVDGKVAHIEEQRL